MANLIFPQSPFLDPTGRPAREWVQWLQNPDVQTITAVTFNVDNVVLTLPLEVIYGGTGLTDIPTNGQLLIGNGTDYTLNTLTAGVGLTITNAAGSITPRITNTGVAAGSYGSATQTGTFTVNAQGQITLASNLTITPAANSLTGLGAGVATALGTNIGTAGSFVLNGGALGTPSSGTVTNLTGTASININGTVGATTPSTGAFTAASVSSQLTLTNASNYNLYASGAGANFMQGKLGIGALASSSATPVNLLLASNITGGVASNGFRSVGVVQSDVTTTAQNIVSAISTAASAFTLTNLRHFIAANATIGAGSAITNQFGYQCNALSGATNNYAFYATSAAAANNFNFYALGTAANVFAGEVYAGGLVNAQSLLVSPVAGSVNYLVISGSAGTTPTLSAAGTNPDIDILITPKGVGNVSFGTYTAGIVAQTGYITIKDAGGTARRLLVG
jgi:hypothetical protein